MPRFVSDDPSLTGFALETTAYSELSEWWGGDVAGTHGTSDPSLVGAADSHGCIRSSTAGLWCCSGRVAAGAVADLSA